MSFGRCACRQGLGGPLAEYCLERQKLSSFAGEHHGPGHGRRHEAEPPALHDFGPVPFSGRADALFERHLLSDAVVDPSVAQERQRFEAVARSVRDILSQRWIKTQAHLRPENPKRIYYLSMEFLIGRSLTNNVTNLLLHPFIERDRASRAASTGSAWSSRSPTPGWAMAASDGWPPASSTRWRPCSSRRWATACATSTACSGSRSRTAGSANSRTTGCADRTRGRSPRRSETVEVKLSCTLRVASGHAADRPRPCRRP